MGTFNDAVFVFDLDGVITDPRDTSVDEVVVGRMGYILEQGGHVAINTGRSFVWVEENLVNRLQAKTNTNNFDRLYIVCEKGGESRIWHNNTFTSQPSRFALAADLIQATHQIYIDHKDEFNTMFWDATKQTMATIEKYPEADIEIFKEQQVRLTQLLHQIAKGKEAKIDVTIAATDVELPLAGKHAGAELIYEWVAKHTSVEHDTFTCFGDSKSDYEMARYFAQQGANTTFVYVGGPRNNFDEEPRVKLITPKALYAAGTAQYLEHIENQTPKSS